MRTALLTVLALQVAWQPAKLPAQPPRELARTQAEVRGRLREPAKFHFTRAPLWDVVRKIQDQHALQTHLVKRALDDEGVSTDAPVTMHLEGVSLETALQLTLEPLGLTWICRDNVLLITAMTHAEYDLAARVYPVSDLFRRGDRPPSSISQAEFDEITNLLVSVTPVSGWDDGPVGSFRHLKRSLVISNSEQHHGIYEHLLGELRRVAGRQPGQEASPEQLRIEKRLAQPVSWQFRQAGLSDLAPVIERELGIPVQINKRALDDEGINVNVPVSITALRQPAAATLRRMLRPLGLSFSIVGEELLLIETQTEVEQRTFPRVYNVLDLVAEDPDDAHPWSFALEYGPLMDALTRSVTPERWDSSGGRATLIPFRGRLVVVHDWHGHQQVAACLQARRRERADADPASFVERVYRCCYTKLRVPLAALVAEAASFDKPILLEEQLTEAIPQLIEPGLWKGAGGLGTIFHCRNEEGEIEAFVVRQTPAVQRRIAQFVERINGQLEELERQAPQERERYGPRLGAQPRRW